MTKSKKETSLEALERIAESGGDTSSFFAADHEIRPGTQMKKRDVDAVRRNIDYSLEMFRRLGDASDELNIPIQAIVKMVLQDWLDRRDLASAAAAARKGRGERR